jgi:light-regulated signal transduction histidine kinase (bacteriophytochrome)
MDIKSRLVILFLVIPILPVMVFGAATTISTEREITTNALRELSALATIQESRVQDVLDQNLEQLVTFTSRLQLKISIDSYNKNGDAESQELANRIIESAQAATPSFREIHVLNMGGVVKTILDGFKEATVGRDVKYTINELPACSCDPSLVRQVWVNLISNAIKFTKNRHPAVIEIGGKSDGDTVVYYAKDNGAGFSMEHASRLFKVFSRLHDQSEFKGTGIGLAIVEKIVRRHGGIAWAEGEARRGAKFAFMPPMILAKKISA